MGFNSAFKGLNVIHYARFQLCIVCISPMECRDGSVGTETDYKLDGPRMQSRWGVILHTRTERPWCSSYLLHNVYRVIPGVRAARAWPWPPSSN